MLFPTLRRRIEHLERWESGTIKVLGMVEVLLAVMLIVVAQLLVAYLIELFGMFGGLGGG
mgnify:CR=1 FL=1